MAYVKITRYGCRPLGMTPLAIGGEPVLAWQHIATGRRIFTCPDLAEYGWRVEHDDPDAFSSSLRAAAFRVARLAALTLDLIAAEPR